jgi:hypothetical protein
MWSPVCAAVEALAVVHKQMRSHARTASPRSERSLARDLARLTVSSAPRRRHRASPRAASLRCPRRRLRGGAVLGHGSFGCVVAPPLAPPPGAPVEAWVGKIMGAADAAAEMAAAAPFAAVDREGRYGLYPRAQRQLTLADADALRTSRRADATACLETVDLQVRLRKMLSDTATDAARADAARSLAELVLPRGGDATLAQELDAARASGALPLQVLATVLPRLRPVARGLRAYHAAGLAHMDVSVSNVLRAPAGGGSGTDYRLIDFAYGERYDTARAAVPPAVEERERRFQVGEDGVRRLYPPIMRPLFRELGGSSSRAYALDGAPPLPLAPDQATALLGMANAVARAARAADVTVEDTSTAAELHAWAARWVPRDAAAGDGGAYAALRAAAIAAADSFSFGVLLQDAARAALGVGSPLLPQPRLYGLHAVPPAAVLAERSAVEAAVGTLPIPQAAAILALTELVHDLLAMRLSYDDLVTRFDGVLDAVRGAAEDAAARPQSSPLHDAADPAQRRLEHPLRDPEADIHALRSTTPAEQAAALAAAARATLALPAAAAAAGAGGTPMERAHAAADAARFSVVAAAADAAAAVAAAAEAAAVVGSKRPAVALPPSLAIRRARPERDEEEDAPPRRVAQPQPSPPILAGVRGPRPLMAAPPPLRAPTAAAAGAAASAAGPRAPMGPPPPLRAPPRRAEPDDDDDDEP